MYVIMHTEYSIYMSTWAVWSQKSYAKAVMKSWLDTPVAMVPYGNTRSLPTSIVTVLFVRVQQCPVSAQYTNIQELH